ncbi:hypothetical protein F3087_06495 [Nocardia colli]|uniref:DUF8017 domain-containing protein n=1 Tax=Nocardia colli TaxID=2545717 RepID=A0A5N0EPB3_9NOCA|nr:hypothetical protein [Nocardia colli]KAA8890873.1 hypothetical protein F3087_06495 [Nocardia colli]
MSGFDDRRNDPTVLGRPGAAHPDQQQPYGADQFDPAGSDAETAEQPAPARPWKRDSGFHEQVQWPPQGPGQPDPTVQWQQGGSTTPAPNYQWQPSPGGQPSPGAPATNSQWQPGNAAPQRQPGGSGQQWQAPAVPGQADPTLMAQPQTPQWQAPGQADPTLMAQPQAPAAQWQAPGQADPTLMARPVSGGQPQQWQAPAAGRADPTLMAQPVSGGQWQPPAAPGQADPTLMAQPQARGLSEPAGLWQPSLGAPEPSQNSPGEAAPTLLGYPNATRLGQPDPAPQWQSAPAYAAPPVYGQPVGGAYAPQSGFGGPPPQQMPPGHGVGGPPPSGRGKAVLLIGLVVLLVAAGAVTAVTLAKRGANNADSQRNSPSMVSALTTSEGAPTPSKTSTAAPTPSSNGRHETPVVPGYQVVVAPDRGAAYDVPAGWVIAPETAIGGYGEPPNAVAGKGYASDGKGYCPGSTRTASFLTGSKDADSGTAATDLGTRTAKLAYTASADARPAPPVPLESLDGTQRGMFVETKGTVTQAKPGCATAYSVYTAAFPTDNGSFVMVITADTGVPNAVDADTAKRIFTSIRPHDG